LVFTPRPEFRAWRVPARRLPRPSAVSFLIVADEKKPLLFRRELHGEALGELGGETPDVALERFSHSARLIGILDPCRIGMSVPQPLDVMGLRGAHERGHHPPRRCRRGAEIFVGHGRIDAVAERCELRALDHGEEAAEPPGRVGIVGIGSHQILLLG
jgi:hypothetical protein